MKKKKGEKLRFIKRSIVRASKYVPVFESDNR